MDRRTHTPTHPPLTPTLHACVPMLRIAICTILFSLELLLLLLLPPRRKPPSTSSSFTSTSSPPIMVLLLHVVVEVLLLLLLLLLMVMMMMMMLLLRGPGGPWYERTGSRAQNRGSRGGGGGGRGRGTVNVLLLFHLLFLSGRLGGLLDESGSVGAVLVGGLVGRGRDGGTGR